MKQFTFSIILLSLFSCSSKDNFKAQEAVDDYEFFIDSIIEVERNFQNSLDTEFIEVVIDPSDTSLKFCCDTIVSLPSELSSIYSPDDKKRIYSLMDSFRMNIEQYSSSFDKDLMSRYLYLNKRADSLWVDHRKDSIWFVNFMDSIHQK